MPKEVFKSEHYGERVEVRWSRKSVGTSPEPGVVTVDGVDLPVSEVKRLIKTLKKARDQAFFIYLADFESVPETAFYSPSDDAISMYGETYVPVNRDIEQWRTMIEEWKTHMQQWSEIKGDA